MADTIKEFLVGLVFKVDSSSERKFTDAIRSATLQADLLARGLEGAAVAVAKAIAQIAQGFESIYYTAQRANTSVGSLRAMTYALSQLGTSASAAQASLSNFGRRVGTDPGAESLLKAIGIRTRDAQGRLRDTTKLFEEFGKATQKMPAYVALGYAQQLGVDEDTMRAMREQPELLARLRHEQEEYARSIGMNQEEAARKGQEFMQSLRRLQMVVTLVSEKILSDLAPALKAFIDQIIEWIRQNPDAIREGLVQIGDAAMAFAKACIAIVKELAPVVTKIGELAASITGHGGLQGTMELFAAFMVGSWALRIVAAITSVSTAWGLMALRLGLPMLIGAVATGHSYQTPEEAAKDPDQAVLQQEGIDRRARVREWMGDKWERAKRLFGGGSAEAGEGRGGAGIRRRAARAAEIDKTNYNFNGDNVNVLKQAAKELGTSPKDLATVISYETGGRFSPSIRGGKNNRYIGLIQFGEPEQRDYGANQQQTFAEQMPAVVRFLKHRGFKPGMDLMQLYKTINGGNPYVSSEKNDGNGTIAQHVARMQSQHQARVERFLASGSQQLDLAGAVKGLDKLMPPEAKPGAGAGKPAESPQDIEKREATRIKRWNEVYKTTGDASKADAASKEAMNEAPTAHAGDKAAPRRPTFAPAFSPEKAPPLAASTDNSRSATLTQHNTFNIQGSEARQTAELVQQGQRSVGMFGLDGIKSVIR
ncbi:phage tail tape measure protein [Methylobacterium sp. J-030]|uniref:phage tail tape measure protein n=1 Tax=Methylobacterium sp. J-030 TaxID=2836627 RepID=UPI001FB9ED9E|nr:phage tail tape measure protein [Methylobacterium sp. J-030]MCJ2069390.1 phage tail tape measure protein [Methylobacterium sp. J-030]